MPIFHDTVDRPPSRSRHLPKVTDASGNNEEEVFAFGRQWQDRSLLTLADGGARFELDENGRPLSREQLIDRIKRRPSPSWSFKHDCNRDRMQDQRSRTPSSQSVSQTPLLPSVEFHESPTSSTGGGSGWSNQAAGMEIERPRSALHSGDFRDDTNTRKEKENGAAALSTSPVAPWHNDFPSFLAARASENQPQRRPRMLSQSSLSKFLFMPPTSPLVQATYNSDLDERSPSPISKTRRSKSPLKDNRRHTFSPQSLQTYQQPMFGSHPSTPRPVPSMRRESTFPYQAHQPRRAIPSLPRSISTSTPQTPLIRPRGLSNASESSPLHHAPMVGSYEESILRGRMSTAPSRPLNFVAQIGVLGRGKCKSSLRCPPHAIVPFPAVFYSYGSGNGRIMDNQPSPYVGLIDIENNVAACKTGGEGNRKSKRYASPAHSDIDDGLHPYGVPLKRKRDKLRKRSQSPKAPPGGCYRIPQQGQLQIIIKNPNKTAVKLFLVPYDLSDMDPGQKTFVRQRSYSAGPIIDMPLSVRSNLGTDRPEASLSSSDDPRDRPVLRYLIHLHICCTGKGRYFLYKSIRVVFANRVPDGKEKLRNEIQLPEPKYSVYKPTRDVPPVHQNPATFALSSIKTLANERAARRRSTPFDFGGCDDLDTIDGMDNWSLSASSVQAIPFALNKLETVESRPSSRDQNIEDQHDSHRSNLVDTNMEPSFSSTTSLSRSGRNDPNSAWRERRKNPFLTRQEPLSRFLTMSSPTTGMPIMNTEGLLTRQLRGLSVEREMDIEDNEK